MGVPKFFRWVSERYPTLSSKVKSDEVPEFDNLYLDMNGIIHPCSHPSDDPTFVITEEQIFDNIFRYLEFLIQTIKPQVTFFMAVDGCAPRAKMNQQRARRFSTAQNTLEAEANAKRKGIILPDRKDKFDSNTITPGTDFMDRLDKALRYFITKRISDGDPIWTKPEIIYSGHQTPGEGEHKIADYIRYIRSDPNYNGELRHCLYGLDADLIHLSLASHEKNFTLLREEVKFTSKKTKDESDGMPGLKGQLGQNQAKAQQANSPSKKSIEKRSKTSTAIVKPENITFYLLSINILRSYLELHEYGEVTQDPFFDKSRIVDDWIFLNFLIGNDFIPHIPHLHIKMQHIPQLVICHKQILLKHRDYLIQDGVINIQMFYNFISYFSYFDQETYQEVESDARWMANKRKHGDPDRNFNSAPTNADVGLSKVGPSAGVLAADGGVGFEFMNGADFDEDDDSEIDMSDLPPELRERLIEQGQSNKMTTKEELENLENTAFNKWRGNYYWLKWKGFGHPAFAAEGEMEGNLDWGKVTQVCRDYFRTLQWICHYYFNGIQAWSWFYPHHYAPFLTDLVHVLNEDNRDCLHFPKDEPFLPFQQLLGVLPATSRHCLPTCFHDLMTKPDSPIADFYPAKFKSDLNGKQQEWEAVVLIPFINEKRLLEAMAPLYSQMTPDEHRRNSHIPATSFRRDFSGQAQLAYKSPIKGKPDIQLNYAVYQHFSDINLHRIKLNAINRNWYKLNATFTPGFPRLDSIQNTAELKKIKVMVFEQPSHHESMVLTLNPKPRDAVDFLEILLNYPIKQKCQPKIIQEGKTATNKTCFMIPKQAKNHLNVNKTYVNWPHLYNAKIAAIFDENTYYDFENIESSKHFSKILVNIHHTRDVCSNFSNIVDDISKVLYKKKGIFIDCNQHQIVFKVYPRIGRKMVEDKKSGKIYVDPIFSDKESYFFAGMCLFDGISKLEDGSVWTASSSSLEKQIKLANDNTNGTLPYEIGSTVFITDLNSEHYGCMGSIQNYNPANRKFQVKFNAAPFIPDIQATCIDLQYEFKKSKMYSSNELCKYTFQCKYNLLNALAGNSFLFYGRNLSNKVKISLGVKNYKASTYKRLYCIPVKSYNGDKGVNVDFRYTQQFVEDIHDYNAAWPNLIQALRKKTESKSGPGSYDIQESDIADWTEDDTQNLIRWLKEEAPWSQIDCTASNLDLNTRAIVRSDIQVIEEELDSIIQTTSPIERKMTQEFSFSQIYQWRPGMDNTLAQKDNKFSLFDRVRLVRPAIGQGIELGQYGTVIAERFNANGSKLAYSTIEDLEKMKPSEIDVVFDYPSENGLGSDLNGRVSEGRGITLNISYFILAQKDSPFPCKGPKGKGSDRNSNSRPSKDSKDNSRNDSAKKPKDKKSSSKKDGRSRGENSGQNPGPSAASAGGNHGENKSSNKKRNKKSKDKELKTFDNFVNSGHSDQNLNWDVKHEQQKSNLESMLKQSLRIEQSVPQSTQVRPPAFDQLMQQVSQPSVNANLNQNFKNLAKNLVESPSKFHPMPSSGPHSSPMFQQLSSGLSPNLNHRNSASNVPVYVQNQTLSPMNPVQNLIHNQQLPPVANLNNPHQPSVLVAHHQNLSSNHANFNSSNQNISNQIHSILSSKPAIAMKNGPAMQALAMNQHHGPASPQVNGQPQDHPNLNSFMNNLNKNSKKNKSKADKNNNSNLVKTNGPEIVNDLMKAVKSGHQANVNAAANNNNTNNSSNTNKPKKSKKSKNAKAQTSTQVSESNETSQEVPEVLTKILLKRDENPEKNLNCNKIDNLFKNSVPQKFNENNKINEKVANIFIQEENKRKQSSESNNGGNARVATVKKLDDHVILRKPINGSIEDKGFNNVRLLGTKHGDILALSTNKTAGQPNNSGMTSNVSQLFNSQTIENNKSRNHNNNKGKKFAPSFASKK